ERQGVFRVGLLVGLESLLPFAFDGGAGFLLVPGGIKIIRNGEAGFIFPAQFGPSRDDFVVTQSGAMGVGAALFGGRAPADDGLAAHRRRPAGFLARRFDRLLDFGAVVAIDVAHHLPAIGFEAFRRLVREPAAGFAVDGNAVIV